jgi:hypothetical protein
MTIAFGMLRFDFKKYNNIRLIINFSTKHEPCKKTKNAWARMHPAKLFLAKNAYKGEVAGRSNL